MSVVLALYSVAATVTAAYCAVQWRDEVWRANTARRDADKAQKVAADAVTAADAPADTALVTGMETRAITVEYDADVPTLRSTYASMLYQYDDPEPKHKPNPTWFVRGKGTAVRQASLRAAFKAWQRAVTDDTP